MSENLTRKLPENSAAELIQMIQAVRAELSDLRSAVETRIYDTRPIWEKVTGDVAKLIEGQEVQKQNLQSLTEDVREIRTHLRDMDRRLSICNDTLVGIQADYRDIYDRVRGLERQRT